MQVELPDEVVVFMKELAKEIKGQDNRATASPYYYIVQGQKQVLAPAGYGDDDIHYYNSEWSEGHSREDWAPILRQHDEENGKTTDLDKFIESCEEFGMHDVDVEENVFLTFKGYEQHMKMNSHNYRHLKDVHSYVKFAYRNPEMENLLKAIMAFAEMKTTIHKE